jgi:hypothetical protein
MKISIGISLLCLTFFFACLDPSEPDRPPNVPHQAKWIGGIDGGVWCSIERLKGENKFSFKSWEDFGGILIADGTFSVRDQNTAENLLDKLDFFDGKDIYFKNGPTVSLLDNAVVSEDSR